MESLVFIKIIIIAVFIEAICETLKMTWQNGKISKDRIIALVVALLLCVGTGADLLKAAGVVFVVPYVGSIWTAILVSRGSSFIHDIMETVGTFYQGQKPPAPTGPILEDPAAAMAAMEQLAKMAKEKEEPKQMTFGS